MPSFTVEARREGGSLSFDHIANFLSALNQGDGMLSSGHLNFPHMAVPMTLCSQLGPPALKHRV
jgi:hypothetical protein